VRYRSVCVAALLGLLAATGTIGLAGEQAGGPSGDPAERPPISFSLPEGTLFLNLPAGWESNPRLAFDNAAVAFLHPSGMELGQAIPMWILIERRLFVPEQSFDSLVRECLAEGEEHGFTAQDSTTIKTTDDRSLINYRFNPTEEGAERSLAFMKTADGAILFRQNADDAKVWATNEQMIQAIFRSVRFLTKHDE
jgi:hypothetical protein